MKVLAFIASLVFVSSALAYTVEGVDHPETIAMEGNTLRLVGVGIRQATVFKVNVYTLGAYTQNPTCNMSSLITSNEPKMLRLHFLRHVSGEKMKENMEKSFAKHTPSDASEDLKKRIEQFIEQFGIDAPKGADVEVRYVPQRGTTIIINGKQMGAPIPGHDFIKILWSIYLSEGTCCPSAREGIIKSCGEINK
jgi:hypothetical protein